MNLRGMGLGLSIIASLLAPLSVAPPAHADSSRAAPSHSSLQHALDRAVARHLAKAGIDAALRGYSLAPSVVQLRRYTEPGKGQSKVVCVVSLAVKGEQNELVGEVRGSAAAVGANASAIDALEGAAESAVGRMPDLLSKLPNAGRDRVAQR